MVIAASAFGLISCVGARPEKIGDVPRSPRIGTTIVASASMNAPPSAAASSAPETIRSCAGPSLCREDALTDTDPDALTDVQEACARVGGTFAPVRCPRAGAAARCSGGSVYGTLTVYVYARGADDARLVARVAEQCEGLAGTFETLSVESVAEANDKVRR
jgi:hypothetical protein